MKLIVAALLLVLAGIITAIFIPMNQRLSGLTVNRQLEENTDSVTATNGGVTTAVTPGNAQYMVFILTVTARVSVMFPPKEPDADAGIVIQMGDSVRVHLVPDGEGDSALFYYSCGGTRKCFRITGYRAMENVGQAVSPDGVDGPNSLQDAAQP